MRRRWPHLAYSSALLLVVLLGGLTLDGCGVIDFIADLLHIGKDKAEAQQEQRIETFRIDAGTFLILSDTAPSVEVKDITTVYTQIDGSVTFRLATGGEQTIALDPEDTVIERPGSGVVTVIRSQTQ